MKGATIRCTVTRGTGIESEHYIEACVIDESSHTLFDTANSNKPVCVRSILKPFQLAAGFKQGLHKKYTFQQHEIAFMSSSHNGEKIHTDTAQALMKRFNISKDSLRCGTHPPYSKTIRRELIKNSSKLDPIYNNCSGKHIAMILLSRLLESTDDSYESLDHPVQQTIFSYLNSIVKKIPDSIGIDGCSAPTPFYPLKSIAILFKELAAQTREELSIIYNAIAKHPTYLAGEKRFDTDFISTMSPKAITKVGGEAVRGISYKEGPSSIGIALKVTDGNQRACGPAALSIMEHLGIITKKNLDSLVEHYHTKLYNHRKIHTGTIQCEITS